MFVDIGSGILEVFERKAGGWKVDIIVLAAILCSFFLLAPIHYRDQRGT